MFILLNFIIWASFFWLSIIKGMMMISLPYNGKLRNKKFFENKII